MSESAGKPQIRFKGFTDAWEQRKFGEIFDFERPDNYTVVDTHYVKQGTPVLTANKSFILGYTQEGGVYDKGNCIIFDDFTLDSKYVDFPFKISSSGIKILTSTPSYNLKFAYYLLNSTNILMQGHARHYISIVQPYFTNVPILNEQNKIEKFVTSIDNLITLHQRKYEKLVNVKKSLLEKMFPCDGETTPKIRFKGFSDAWEQRKFDSIVTRIGTGLNPRDNFVLNSGGKNYYVTIKNFEHGHLYLDDNCDKVDDNALKIIQARSDLKINDILFTSIGRIGDCYLIKKQPKNWNINESVFTLRPNLNEIEPEYLFHVIHSERVLNKVLSDVTGSTFKSIKINDLKKIDIPVTTKVEQITLALFISKIENIITLHQSKLEKLKYIKKSLLEKMFA